MHIPWGQGLWCPVTSARDQWWQMTTNHTHRRTARSRDSSKSALNPRSFLDFSPFHLPIKRLLLLSSSHLSTSPHSVPPPKTSTFGNYAQVVPTNYSSSIQLPHQQSQAILLKIVSPSLLHPGPHPRFLKIGERQIKPHHFTHNIHSPLFWFLTLVVEEPPDRLHIFWKELQETRPLLQYPGSLLPHEPRSRKLSKVLSSFHQPHSSLPLPRWREHSNNLWDPSLSAWNPLKWCLELWNIGALVLDPLPSQLCYISQWMLWNHTTTQICV